MKQQRLIQKDGAKHNLENVQKEAQSDQWVVCDLVYLQMRIVESKGMQVMDSINFPYIFLSFQQESQSQKILPKKK